MHKQAPTPARLATMVVFALSCFGLLLYLWTAFGGPTPLKPEGYRFKVSFAEATQLSEQADVRISGVPVGKVVLLASDDAGRTTATIELESSYAPLPRDARAILRLKTLLGETYVELTPGSPGAPKLAEGALLPRSQVQPTVELDEVLRALDTETRADLKRWVTGWARAVEGRGRDLNDVAGNLPAAVESAGSLVAILDAQERAVSTGIRDTGRVFGALGRQDAAVRTLITAGDRVLRTTASRGPEIERLLTIFPTFEDELRPTLTLAADVAREAAPLVRALRPSAPLVRPVLRNVDALAPDVESLLRRVDPVLRLTATGLPAATRTVRAARPLMAILYPVARDLGPIADYLGLYRREFVTMWMNVAAATQAKVATPGSDTPLHYLRVLIPVTNEAFVQAPQRLASNRHNSYLAPGGLAKLATGLLESFDCRNTANPQSTPVIAGEAPAACKTQEPPEFRGVKRGFPRVERDGP